METIAKTASAVRYFAPIRLMFRHHVRCRFTKKMKALVRKYKRVWFAWYWLICSILAIISLFFKHSDFAIGLFSVIFLTQKQKLEETRLFSELFTEFNSRYDHLNDKITDIKPEEPPSQKQIEPPNQKQIQKTLDDYFNLCAEEYLFYEEGRILDSVWAAWCRGMKEHLKTDAIRDYWERAQKENSYYGLTTPVIEEGARVETSPSTRICE